MNCIRNIEYLSQVLPIICCELATYTSVTKSNLYTSISAKDLL